MITSVAMCNFLSFGPTPQVVDLKDKGLVLIEGENEDDPKSKSNGAGKSAVLEAIVWGLFGQTLRGLKADEVINNTAGKSCEVVVEGDINGVPWQIHRYRKLASRTGSSGLDFKIDHTSHTAQGDQKETQRKIEKHLGATFATFTNTTVFGQGAKWRFTDLTDSQRKALLDKILGLEVITGAYDIVKQKHSEESANMNTCDQEMNQLAASMKNLQETIDEVQKTYNKNRKRDLADAREESVDLLKRIKKTKAATASPHLADDLLEAEAHLKATRTAQLGNIEELTEQRAKRNEAQKEATQASDEVADLTVAISDFDSLIGTRCDGCGSKITKKTAARHSEHLEKQLGEASFTVRQANSRLMIAKDRIKIAEAARPTVDKNITAKEEKVEELRDQLRDEKDRKRQLKDLRAQREKAKVKILKLEITSMAPTKKLNEQMNVYETQHEAFKREYEKYETDEAHYAFWLKGFGNGGVRSYFLDHVMPILNKRAAKYAHHLMDRLVVEFDTETALKKGGTRDKLNLKVTNPYGATVYNGNSGGERRKVDIVVARALQSLEEGKGGHLGLSWWDEVFESLDETSCEAVMEMLRDEAKSKPSVFVVSHLEWLKPHFPRVLRVIKEGGFSRVEWT